jgi:hypothetical protein
MSRVGVILVAGVFILGFGFLTLSTIYKEGLTLGGLVSVFVLVLLLVGVVGSLRDPPRR